MFNFFEKNALLKKTDNEFSGDDTIRTENFFKGNFAITYDY